MPGCFFHTHRLSAIQTSVTALNELDLSTAPPPTPMLAPEPSSSEESLPCELYDRRSRSAELERNGTGRETYRTACVAVVT